MSNEILGILGATILLVCFALNQFNVIANRSPLYDFGNAFGAILLAIYAYNVGSWPFVVLELVWAAVSLRDLVTYIASPMEKQ